MLVIVILAFVPHLKCLAKQCRKSTFWGIFYVCRMHAVIFCEITRTELGLVQLRFVAENNLYSRFPDFSDTLRMQYMILND